MRRVFLIVLFLIPFALFAQEVNYEGVWAVNNGSNDSSKTDSYLSITRLDDENKFLILSVDMNNRLFNFIGGGFIREDGYLQLTTLKGHVWMITPAFSARHDESISLTDLENVESFGWFVRADEKIEVWSFPLADQK